GDERAGDQQAVHGQIRPAPAVRETGQQRGERADRVPDHRHVDEVREGHVVVRDDRGGDRVLDVELVVEDYGRDHDDREVGVTGRGVRVADELPVPERVRSGGAWGAGGG